MAEATLKNGLNLDHVSPLTAVSPQAKYTDRSTTAVGEGTADFLGVEGVSWSAHRIPTADNRGFLDQIV
jgi:hypothetical protein